MFDKKRDKFHKVSFGIFPQNLYNRSFFQSMFKKGSIMEGKKLVYFFLVKNIQRTVKIPHVKMLQVILSSKKCE